MNPHYGVLVLKLTVNHDVYNSSQFNENKVSSKQGILGAFHSTQNSDNFGWYIKWNGPFRFGPTGILGTSFEGGPQ